MYINKGIHIDSAKMQGHPPFFLTDSSNGRLRKDSTFAAGNIFLSAKLYDQSYYACACGYPIPALKLLACTVKSLPCTVRLLPCTVKLLANAVKFLPRTVKLFANTVKLLPRTVKSLANAVKLLANAVKLLPRTVKNSDNTGKFYLYARNSPEC